MHPHHNAALDFNELLLRLYRLAQELPVAQFQDAALAQIKLVLPFDSSMWGTATTTAQGIDIHTVHLHEQPAEMLLAYEPLKHLDTAAASVMGQPRVTEIYHTPTYFNRPDQEPLRQFLRQFEINNVFISAETQLRLSFVHWISLYRANEQAYCTEDERQRKIMLAPHMMQALAMNRVMHLEKLEGADRALTHYGSAIADERGMVYHADPRFRQLAEAEWPGWNGVALPADLMQGVQLRAERFTGRAVVMRPYIEHGLLFLKARQRCRADLLTLREHEIARRIAKGESHKQIAQALGRAPATVRNQIQTLYDKLEVGSIATLIEALREAE
jgi:DNA-binding CsgD family transcriptional regulator